MAQFAAYPDDDPARFQVRRPKRRRRASSTAWFLRLTTVFLAFTGILVIGDFALSWSKLFDAQDGRSTDPIPVAVFVADYRLTVPANMFRFPAQRSVGPHEHVELAVHWPTLEGYTRENRRAFYDPTAEAAVLFITIRRRETVTDSAGRLVSVYQHYFGDGELAAPEGLVGRRLNEDSGLSGEEVYFEAGSLDPFTVHCLAPDDSGYPAPCVSELHAGDGLSVQLRFRKGLLADWADIKASSRMLLMSFGLTT